MAKITDRLNTIISGSTTPAIIKTPVTKTLPLVKPSKSLAVGTNAQSTATEKAMNSAYKATKVFK